ncbi:MAG: DUF5063 domain-containing protein [Bacteroidales bacterium]|nr:DUF5063 domain-containing protein [Bacteroidales bacterium]
MDSFDSAVYSRNTIEFVTVANEFCKYLENCVDVALPEFVDTAHRVLPLLYLKATLLPVMEEAYEEFNEKFVTEAAYNQIQEALIQKFGNFNLYDEILDPLRQENDEPAQLSIAETFADIYQDVKDFLMQYRTGADEIMINAVWECRQSFEQYWGQKTANLMRVLHHLKYTIVDLNTDTGNELGTDKNTDFNKIDTKNWFITRMQEGYSDEE